MNMNAKNIIEVCLLCLSSLQENYDELFACLNEQEQQRAQQLKVENKKKQFVLARAVLKNKIAKRLGLSLEEVLFDYLAHGKPVLAKQANKNKLRFNVSHSADFAAIAISEELKLGIDIEKKSADIEYDKLAMRFFSKEEYVYISSLALNEKQKKFFDIWSAKEAFIKAQGDGVSFGLDKFTVPLEAKTTFAQVNTLNPLKDDWYVANHDAVEDYSLAICVDKPDVFLDISFYSS